ncbi:protein SCAI-like [Notothenia coriiceps]|uniref:Protein SCAI-like n=1 Tax=Notothenia coriiceps TaxID=8208 RepID=A0A6I9Q1V2_9TELE|nr:PREDICTED: protein SCAI-like [Notothenia coriiceps]
MEEENDQCQRGSLFTLFLYSPLLAFSSVCGLSSVHRGLWERAQEFLHKVYHDIGQMITRSRTIDQAFLQFFGDEFLRLLLIRFVFCSAALRLHKLFRSKTHNCRLVYIKTGSFMHDVSSDTLQTDFV